MKEREREKKNDEEVRANEEGETEFTEEKVLQGRERECIKRGKRSYSV